MKAVFMSVRPQNLTNVYGRIREKLTGELDFLPDVTSAQEIGQRGDLSRVELIFSTWGMPALTEEQIRKYFPSLRAVFYAAGTVKAFAAPLLSCGITVCSAWRANGIPVAEIAASEIILANKGFFRRRIKSRDEWSNDDPDVFYPGNFGTKVGILGAGAVGKRVIGLLKGTDIDICVFDPFLPDAEAEKLGVKKESLHWIFKNCNVISNHLANNPQTEKMIDESCFSAMGNHAVFINTGRGAQTDEKSLIAAMKAEPGRLALLDVTDPIEPPEKESELYLLPNVILTPHIAGSTGFEVCRMAEYMYDEYRAFVSGGELEYSVTAQMLKTMA